MKITCAFGFPALFLASLFAAGAQSQPSVPERPAFEVASVKIHPATPGPFRSSSNVGPGGIDYVNVNLKGCIRNAYGVEAYRIIGGPDWLTSERYDIAAKASSAVP